MKKSTSLGEALRLYLDRINIKRVELGQGRLTQAELARLVGVSSTAMRDWLGDTSVPTEVHLKELLKIYLQQGAFLEGQELREAQEVWMIEYPHRPFDANLLRNALVGPHKQFSESLPKTVLSPGSVPQQESHLLSNREKVDWRKAPSIGAFYGPEKELEKSPEGVQPMDAGIEGATLALSNAQIQKTLLLVGYVYVEEAGRELVLIRGDGRLPPMKLYTGSEGTLESAIDDALLDLFEDLGISIKDVLTVGFSKPFHCPLYKVNRQKQTIELRPCVFFKLRLNRTIEGIKATWKDKHYRWEPKTRVSKIWARGQFTYAERDVDESLVQSQAPFDDDPYAAIQEDWISMELGFKLLECVAMFIFRQNEKSEIEFLIMRRRDNERWEYPKGGLHYHETPLEGALREIDEEVGIQEYALHYCASLGWQTADWRESKRFYEILRVHGITFFYNGNPAAIDLDGSHDAYAWCTFEEARERILNWLPYAAEFFRRWQEKRQDIYQVAGI